MKKLNEKIRYTTQGTLVRLFAMPRAGLQRWTCFAECHIASIPELKAKGLKPCTHLLRITRTCQLGPAA